MSYANLKAEMVKHGITQANAADLLGMTSNNFSMKIREKVPFTVDEMKRLRDEFFPLAQLDYLCESDGDVPLNASRDASASEAYRDCISEGEFPCVSDLVEERDKLCLLRETAKELGEPTRTSAEEVVGECINVLDAEIERRVTDNRKTVA